LVDVALNRYDAVCQLTPTHTSRQHAQITPTLNNLKLDRSTVTIIVVVISVTVICVSFV